MLPISTSLIFEPLELVPLLVLGMGVSSLIQWWIFKRVKGQQFLDPKYYLLIFGRYMNMDYSICNALSYHSEGISKALVIYDIGCQWSTNFHHRVESSFSLSHPEPLEIIPAVGKFHLAAHKLACFPRYSLNFIKGAGHLDGEILETLWVPFNKISLTTRSMSQAHRQEVYDDHMRDSNWKKNVGIGSTFFWFQKSHSLFKF